MGRSVAQFLVPGWTQEHILGVVTSFASENRLRVDSCGPNHVYLSTGSIWWTGKRNLTVLAWNAPGGTNVRVEVWVEGLADLNANPREFLGFVPRRDAWRIASSLVSRFGVVPEGAFLHF